MNLFSAAIEHTRVTRHRHTSHGILRTMLSRAFAPVALSSLSHRHGSQRRVVVLGVGNVQWGDAGAGIRVLESLQANWTFPPHVEFAHGNTQGRALLPVIGSTQRLIVLNSVNFGLAPGTLRVLHGDDAAEYLYQQHTRQPGMGLADAFAYAKLTGHSPREIVLIGIQPHEGSHYGAQISAAVLDQVGAAVEAALTWLRRWDVMSQPRASAP